MIDEAQPYLQIPKGWDKPVQALIRELNDLKDEGVLLPHFRIVSATEVYGRLVVHTKNRSSLATNLISAYVDMCNRTCQDCGYPQARRMERNKWIRTLCPFCAKLNNYS